MARTKREVSPLGLYHVLLRSEENLFPTADDKHEFEQICKKYFTDGRVLYSLAMNEYKIHLIFSDGGDGISEIIKPLTTSYARYYNRTYNRTGKLFTDRYKSTAISDEKQLADCVIYVDSTYEISDICQKDRFFEDICTKAEYEKRISGKLEKVCMDSFDTFSKDDIIAVICRMADISSSELLDMDEKQKKEIIRTASSCKWVSVRRMCEAVGIEGAVSTVKKASQKAAVKNKPDANISGKTKKKNVEKTAEVPVKENIEESIEEIIEEKPRNNNLSVWLL